MFVYILMCDKEEWVLVWLGSQNKRVNRSFKPVFSDYIPVSCDYAFSKCCGQHIWTTGLEEASIKNITQF